MQRESLPAQLRVIHFNFQGQSKINRPSQIGELNKSKRTVLTFAAVKGFCGVTSLRGVVIESVAHMPYVTLAF